MFGHLVLDEACQSCQYMLIWCLDCTTGDEIANGWCLGAWLEVHVKMKLILRCVAVSKICVCRMRLDRAAYL